MKRETLVNQVVCILDKYPYTRNSDIALMVELWKEYYPESIMRSASDDFVSLKRLYDLPREDNIKRIRAKIQNEEMRFLPTSLEVFIERARISKDWRSKLGYAPTMSTQRFKEILTEYYHKLQEVNQEKLF